MLDLKELSYSLIETLTSPVILLIKEQWTAQVSMEDGKYEFNKC